MLYEKKMLILSGEGKGVVMIEKSGRGVRFSLKTFDMPYCGELKAGVITRRAVNVRDLPKGDNPASVFILDGLDDISELHFAVFDKRLRLYGAIGKKMWEANVMDLLCKNDRRPAFDNGVRLGALPPISTPPRVLPMPDGTGAPQARLSIYGDEAQTIKGNCNNWVFLNSRESVLLNELSELCGEVDGAPLITAQRLQRLDKEKGQALILYGRNKPFMTNLADIVDLKWFLLV